MNFGPSNKGLVGQMLHFPLPCYAPDAFIILVVDEPKPVSDHPV